MDNSKDFQWHSSSAKVLTASMVQAMAQIFSRPSWFRSFMLDYIGNRVMECVHGRCSIPTTWYSYGLRGHDNETLRWGIWVTYYSARSNNVCFSNLHMGLICAFIHMCTHTLTNTCVVPTSRHSVRTTRSSRLALGEWQQSLGPWP